MAATPALASAALPNDPEYTRQQEYFDRIRLPEAWDAAVVSRQVRVAVVDTGVDPTHPDLTGRVLQGHDFVNDDAHPDDDQWHGTWVAAIVAANANNGIGIAGVSPSAQILPVKVLDAQGNGTEEDIAAGITWAADQGAEVINLSLRAPGDSPAIREAVRHALARDAVVVAAAGNGGSSVPQYPAAYPGVVAVAATDANGDSAPFSNHGDWIDIAAPGVNITSARSRSSYEAMSGTSYAAPIVSGVAALTRSVYPSAAASQIILRLLDMAREAGPAGVDPYFGHGIVDALAAVAAANELPSPPPPPPAQPPPSSPPASPPPLLVPAVTPGATIPPPSTPPAAVVPTQEAGRRTGSGARADVPAAVTPSAEPKRGGADAVLSARLVAVRRNGTAAVPIACRSRNTHCRGTATLHWSGRIIGRAPFSLTATERGTIAVRLARHAVRRLRQKGTLAVRAIVDAGSGSRSVSLVTLRRIPR